MMHASTDKPWSNSYRKKHSSLVEILQDKDLAKLGDAYVNFIFSLADSQRRGKGSNIRISARILAESLRRAELRTLLPKRTPTHDQADAVEALVVYAWLTEELSLEECVQFLSEQMVDDIEPLTKLVREVVRRLKPKFDEPNKIQGDQA